MADEKTGSDTVTVELRRSIGLRSGALGGSRKLVGPGRVAMPRSVAEANGFKVVEGEPTRSATATGGTQGNGGDTTDQDPYKDWVKADFVAEAERRNLTVARTDGQDGDPRVVDYRAALDKDDAARATPS